MRAPRLVTLLAVAGGLGLAGCSKPSEGSKARSQKAPEEKLFDAEAPGERAKDAAPVFTHLTVKARGSTTTLERKEGAWRITAPVSAPADRAVVEALLSQLQSAKLKTAVAENPTDADLEKYGLKSPSFTVTAKAYMPDAQGGGADDPARQHTLTLQGGLENTFDGSVYVRRDSDPRVYSASGAVRFALDKGPFELREKEFLGLSEASLKSIDVKAKAKAWTLERGEDKAWRLVKPSALRADNGKVTELVNGLKGQHALAFPADSEEERKRLGFDKPVVDARFTSASGEPVRVRLTQVTRDGDAHVYALREQGTEATLAEVPSNTPSVLDVAPRQLRDKSVLTFKREAVQRIVFHPGEGAAPFTLSRMKGAGIADDWNVEVPPSGKAQKWKVVAVLGALQTLKALEFDEANPKRWEKYGLTDAARGVTLLGEDGKELARLWLGNEVPDQPDRLYARGTGPELLEVDSSRLGELPEKVSDMLEPPPSALDAGTASPTP